MPHDFQMLSVLVVAIIVSGCGFLFILFRIVGNYFLSTFYFLCKDCRERYHLSCAECHHDAFKRRYFGLQCKDCDNEVRFVHCECGATVYPDNFKRLSRKIFRPATVGISQSKPYRNLMKRKSHENH